MAEKQIAVPTKPLLTRPDSRLPPLSTLRAFEATARHGSMSRAATELNVTHGAVSRQIAALEDLLRVTLFRRRARGVQLTEHGTRLFHGVFSGFERVRASLEDLREDHESHPVTVTTLPTVARRWLLPRLADFHALHPTIVVQVRTRMELEDLAQPSIDFAIRYGDGNWPNTTADALLTVRAFPVCSEKFLQRHRRVSLPADLLRLPLIHDTTRQWWIDWLVAAGAKVGELSGGIIVDDYELALQFALDGYGIALARDVLVEQELETGALVRLSPVSVVPRFAYYLARDSAKTPSRESRILIQWLTDHDSTGGAKERNAHKALQDGWARRHLNGHGAAS
jgi:LysR family glycine cleavage system transcriptional activator